MTQEITNKALQWARYELAAREAEEVELAETQHGLDVPSRKAERESVAKGVLGVSATGGAVQGGNTHPAPRGHSDVSGAGTQALPSQLNPSREAANSILEELTPLFAEQARIRRWNEMRPGKEPRLI